MKKELSLKDKTTKEFFGKKFSQYLNEWKKKTGRNQEDFAELILSNKNSITNYKQGKDMPREDDTVYRIVKELNSAGIDISYEDFILHDLNDKYEYDTDYIDNLSQTEIAGFCNEIGLDISFLKAIRTLYGSDFDSIFPIWTPIVQNPKSSIDHTYIRLNESAWKKAAKSSGDSHFFQCEISINRPDGKKESRTIMLSKDDLRFLKDVQDSAKDFIGYLFMKRKKELIEEAEAATKASIIKKSANNWEIIKLQAEDLNRIDKYHEYKSPYDYPNNIEP